MPPSPLSLAGKTAVVTGASRGIGRAIALQFAVAGVDVLVHARANQSAAEQTRDEIHALGRQSEVLLADLATDDGVNALAEHGWSWRGGVDIWVNNAGVDVLTGNAAAWSFEQKLHALWQVDVRATIRLSREIGARMKAQGNGVILNIGWDQAETGMEGDSGEMFAAVKGAVMSFTRSLAKSLATEVRVNCLAPGWIKTAWGETASAEWQARAVSESLLARWGTPEDVAAAALFLASSASSFLTAQTLPINGGHR